MTNSIQTTENYNIQLKREQSMPISLKYYSKYVIAVIKNDYIA